MLAWFFTWHQEGHPVTRKSLTSCLWLRIVHSLLCLKCCLEVKACVYCTLTTTFNGPFSRTTQVSRYQKGRTHTHPFNGPFSGTTGWMPFLLPNQQRKSSEGQAVYTKCIHISRLVSTVNNQLSGVCNVICLVFVSVLTITTELNDL